jgi:hypothetical protein
MSIENKVQTVRTERRLNVKMVTCDGCGTEAVLQQVTGQNGELVIPVSEGTWFFAGKVVLDDPGEGMANRLDFCSPECLKGWLDRADDVEEIEIEATPGRKVKEAATA